MLRNDLAAEEVVQDTFVKAYRGLRSFRGEASVRTWLLAICRRTCVDRLRSQRLEPVPLESMAGRPAREEPWDLRLMLERALEDLPREEREAFVLVHALSYSREEAARICGVPASTMRSRVTRARQRLADFVTDAETRDMAVA